jgi:hypothetical protein
VGVALPVGTKRSSIAGVTEVREVEPGSGEEALDESGPVLHAPEPGLGEGGELGDVALGEVGDRSLEVGPDGLDRVELGLRGSQAAAIGIPHDTGIPRSDSNDQRP